MTSTVHGVHPNGEPVDHDTHAPNPRKARAFVLAFLTRVRNRKEQDDGNGN